MIANLIFRANERLFAKSVASQASQFASSSSSSQSTANAVKDQPSKSSSSLSTRSPSQQSKSVIQSQQQQQAGQLKEFEEYNAVDRPLLYHDQMQFLDERQVRISKPSKNVMQSGTAYLNTWKIEFDSKERWEYWLMGWTSSRDPLSNLTMTFPTKEAAVAFCDKNKLQWYIEEQPDRKVRRKSYADNFAYKKRYRLGSK